MEQVKHNPGPLKQHNKTHKTGRHRSKGEILKTNKGKVGIKVISRKNKDSVSRDQRKNRLNQLRKNKREEILNKKRSIGALNGAPHVISIIPLSTDVNTFDAINVLMNCDAQANTKITPTGSYIIESTRFKTKYNIFMPNPLNLNAIIDAIKITDTCIFLMSINNTGIDGFGNELFNMIFSYNLPTSLFVVQGLKSLPIKLQASTREHLQRTLDEKFLDTKLLSLDNESDALNLLYKISQHKLKITKFNELRPYMISEKYEFEPYKINPNMGTLKLYGYIRGANLDVNSLVYLPTMGTFQMSDIYSLKRTSDRTQETYELNQQANPAKQETLDTEAKYDDMNAEQTWPTEEELKEADLKSVKKRVPKGTSDYQAAWILDSEEEEVTDNEEDEANDNEDIEDDDESEDSDEEEEDDDEFESEDENGNYIDDQTENGDEDMETVTINGDDKYDEKLDLEEEKRTLEKIKEAKMNEKFPDEVDTPLDVPARVRFQKYRGMKSFRTSPWDKYENLPIEYGRIYQFEDIKRTFKKISKEKSDGVEPGTYVQIHIKNVPSSIHIVPGHPLIMYGLLKHENKISILNFKLKRVNQKDYDLPIKSKESLIFHVGCRRFEAGAIYSQHTNGDKHKFERFMPTDGSFVATLFAPITFPPSSVLVFKKLENDRLILIATGCVHSIDPNRIVLKRIVLSGHPFRANKKNAVVRYMFFTPEDVNWFKPVELRTKYGRRGHIKEPLGTHGHMKCQFNDIMKSQDTVLMNLYKRVYPKWTYRDLSTDFLETNH